MNIITKNEPLDAGPDLTLKAYSVDTFCKMFSIGRTLAYAEIKAGRLKIAKIGRRTLIPAKAAKDWLDNKTSSEVCHEQ